MITLGDEMNSVHSASGSKSIPAEHESSVVLSIEHIGMWRQWGRERFSVAHLHGYELLCDTALLGATCAVFSGFPDITGPAAPVEVQIRADGTALWINIGGECVLRICQIKKIIIDDERSTHVSGGQDPEIAQERNEQ